MPSSEWRRTGRILYLTEDPELLARQLAGEDLPVEVGLSVALLDNVSTDEITPAWACFHHDQALGDFALIGLRGGAITRGSLRGGGFQVIVSGKSKGCGSSREQAPYAERAAGIELVVAQSLEKIYRQNCQNIGLLTSSDLDLLRRVDRREPIAIEELVQGLDPISAEIVRSGGLFSYQKRRRAGELAAPSVQTPPRPMTLAEKIIASHAVLDATTQTLGVPAVRPGDALFVRADVRFSHEYVTPMAEAIFVEALGPEAKVSHPESALLFRDHLTFLGRVMPEAKKQEGLLSRADGLAATQRRFADKHGLALYGEVPRGGSHAICHNLILEEVALPGQVVIGTDSHTCMAGAVGALAFGVGATDMASAWYSRDVRITVPETVRFVLRGALREGVSAKDLMLFILARPFFRSGRGIGKVLELAGDVAKMPLDEQATLTNMAVEAGGMTGIIEPAEITIEALHRMRGIDREQVRARVVRSDPDAEYLETFEIDLAEVPVMIATPGDPRNGVPLATLSKEVAIDIAYGGSCTGGKKADMDMYARVFEAALARGQGVADGVRCFIQFGSQHIRSYAEARGYLEIFARAGVETIEPSCGACINAGPGASSRKEQVTVSAINRNFPGRSGPGQVYLASPLTVAASAIAGRIVSAEQLERALESR